MGSIGTMWVNLTARVAGFMKGMDKAERRLRRFSTRMKTVGRDMTFGVSMPIIFATKNIIDAFTKWEDAFVGVRKTVDATEEQFQSLSKEIRRMATEEFPLAASEIANIVANLGQLGSKYEDLIPKTREVIAVTLSSRMSHEEASIAMGKFANVMGVTADEYDNMASTIVFLGNNFAAFEDEILDTARHLVGAGKAIGLTKAEALALATAMTAAGSEAQASGTLITKMLIEMDIAVRSGNKSLSTFARVSGQTADEFKASWSSSKGGAIASFLEGLSKIGDQEGAQLVRALRDTNLESIRIVKTALAAAGAIDTVKAALLGAQPAWDRQSDQTDEVNKRIKSAASQFTMIGNRLTELKILIGTELVPEILKLLKDSDFKNFTDTLKDIVINLVKLSELTGGFSTKLLAFMVAAGPVLFFFGSFNQAVIATWGVLKVALPAIGALLAALAATAA
ncbi:MAG: phage tail tape measure protein, partial [Dehalococcoidia bacterium]|nr:phage tail tape measure protein [Dehalococcoidia bacterium]